jgi:hypothetical protein
MPSPKDRHPLDASRKILMLARSFLRVIAAVVISGCATPYSVEGAAEVALVRFTSNFSSLTTFDEIQDLSFCPRVVTRRIASMSTAPFFDERSSLSMYGSSPKPELLIRERKVVAGKRLLMHVSAGYEATPYTRGYHCGLGVSFTPAAGRQYEVRYLNANNGCTVDVSQLSVDASGAVVRSPEPTAQRIRAAYDNWLCPK